MSAAGEKRLIWRESASFEGVPFRRNMRRKLQNSGCLLMAHSRLYKQPSLIMLVSGILGMLVRNT